VFESGSDHGIVSNRPVAMQRIGVKIATDDYRQSGGRGSIEQILDLQHLERWDGFLLQVRAHVTEVLAANKSVHRAPAAEDRSSGPRDLDHVGEVTALRIDCR